MLASLRAGLVFVVGSTLLLGLAYPLLATGGAGLLAPNGSAGSLVKINDRVVGSSLVGQGFAGQPRYFQSRPSPTGYSANATAFSNLGPNGRDTAASFTRAMSVYLHREKPFVPGLGPADVPASAVMASGSGIDPNIEPADARIQAHRIASLRGLSPRLVDELIRRHTNGRFLGLIGEPTINVLELNLALDKEEK